MTIEILGERYSIEQSNKVKDANLESCDGYCDTSIKSIVIDTFHDSPNSVKDLDKYKKKVLRHELIHAFLFESGLDGNSWARDEEIVDWIANQFPKMLKAFEIAKCL